MPTERANDNKHFPHCLFMSNKTQDTIIPISTTSNKTTTMLSNTVGSAVNEKTNPSRQMNNTIVKTHQYFRIKRFIVDYLLVML